MTAIQQQQKIVLGEIMGPHGLQGEVRVRIASDDPEPLLNAEAVWLGKSSTDPEARRYRVHGCGLGRKGEVRVRFQGVEGREAVARLIGLIVTSPATLLPELPAGEFYWYELIGCQVESESGEQVGSVREIWETGAHDVLVVEGGDGSQHLISTARELVPEIDPEAGRIVIESLPGLLEPE